MTNQEVFVIEYIEQVNTVTNGTVSYPVEYIEAIIEINKGMSQEDRDYLYNHQHNDLNIDSLQWAGFDINLFN